MSNNIKYWYYSQPIVKIFWQPLDVLNKAMTVLEMPLVTHW